MTILKIYCDGCCKGNPGKGGWGVLLEYGEHKKELYGSKRDSTNNQMELLAAIKGLEALKNPSEVTLYSDSNYLVKGMNEWIVNWKKTKWNSSELKNFELWKRLDELNSIHDVSWKWVKGHSGHIGNERADYLANIGVSEIL